MRGEPPETEADHGSEDASSAERRRDQAAGVPPGLSRARIRRRLKARARRQEGQAQNLPISDQDTSVTPQDTSVTPLLNRPSAAARRIEQRLTVTAPRRALLADRGRGQYFVLQSNAARRKRNYAGLIGFAVCVLLPMLLATIYYGLIASNQYVAEFRFSVQDTSSTSTTSTSAIPGLSSILGGSTISSANNNYLVADYLTSREAIDELQKRINVASLYSKPNIDWWSRFNSSKPIEKFVTYWQSMVSANYDQVTGLATATVNAFSPEDALLIANNLVKLSEELINQIANRSAQDAVRFAQKEVEKAQERLKETRAKLTDYRDRVGVIDPTTSVTVSNSTLVQQQRANLAALETQLATYMRQNLSPTAPVATTLKNQIKATRDQLAATEADVARGVNGAALSKVVGEYEQINLDVQFAQTMVTSTMTALDQARANAAAQHLYITPYVRPSLPGSATYPRRIISILTVGALALGVWIILVLFIRSIRERFA